MICTYCGKNAPNIASFCSSCGNHLNKSVESVTQNSDMDFNNILVAAKQGDAEAQLQLSFMYDTGQSIAVDNNQALYWCEQAAQQGHLSAQFKLASMYYNYNDPSTAKDYNKAMYWYEQAANQEDADAQFILGDMYETGKGSVVNITKAQYWYEKSVQNGKSFAKHKLDNMRGNVTETHYNNKSREKKDIKANNVKKYVYCFYAVLIAIAFYLVAGVISDKNNTNVASNTANPQQNRVTKQAIPDMQPPPQPQQDNHMNTIKNTIYNFYEAISNRQYETAYAYFSNNWKSGIDYGRWVHGFDNTISNKVEFAEVSNATDNTATVNFRLIARDRDQGGVVVQVFEGKWKLILRNNKWLLDEPDINRVRIYRE
jgi:hypothetical protein